MPGNWATIASLIEADIPIHAGLVIYTEFTLQANIAMAAALSFILGAVTWLALGLARTVAGASVAAAD